MLKKIKVSGFFLGFFVLMLLAGMAIEAISLLLALFIHESGHIIAARLLGCKVEKLAIQPLGGYLHLDQLIDVQPATESRIALAGPMANLFAATIVMAGIPYSEGNYLVEYFIRANLILMAFNLFPALPLDGGRVLRARLVGWFSFYRATQIVITSGLLCGIFLMVAGVLIIISGSINPTVFAAGLFLLYNAYIEKKQLLVPIIRYVLGRQKSLRSSRLMIADTLVAAPGTRVNEVLKHIRPQKYYQVSVLDQGNKITGTLTEHQLLSQIMAGTGQRSLLDIVEAERKD